MDVLVVGYGKIGQIKADIWRSLGRNVYVYDTDTGKIELAKANGCSAHSNRHHYSDDLIADISTPAMCHLQSLEWLLKYVNPSRIVVEKPLASTAAEKEAWLKLLTSKEFVGVEQRIAVNESYYLSTALQYVVNDIKQHDYHIQSVRAELSKNRLPDVADGRFVDEHLGSLGIELPHMLAMLQRLGFSLAGSVIRDVIIYRGTALHNEGFRLDLAACAIPIIIESYLGDFRVTESGQLLPNSSITRLLEVTTDGNSYTVEFDPAPGLERYKSRIHIRSNESVSKNKAIVVDDDHLRGHLSKLHGGLRDEQLDALFAPSNALAVADYILDLKSAARYRSVESQVRLAKSSVRVAVNVPAERLGHEYN